MANEYLTMLDVAKMNASDPVVGLIEENISNYPEVSLFPARTIAGTSFDALVRTALPSGYSFRKPNEGVETTKSTYAIKRVSCAYIDRKCEIDVAVADGISAGTDYALAAEASGQMQSAIQSIASQIWYGTGTGGDSDGFPGAVQVVDSDYVYDATGTTDNTCSSVYGVKLGLKYGEILFGQNQVLQIGEWTKQRITRDSKELTAWLNSIEGWCGLNWANKNSVCRIKKLTADSGKGLTDSVGIAMLAKMPANWRPDYWFMSNRSLNQLRLSRVTALNVAPPIPTEMCGIPIVATDAITNTEKLTL